MSASKHSSILLKCTLCLFCLPFKQDFQLCHCYRFPIWNSSWKVQKHDSDDLLPDPWVFWASHRGCDTPHAQAFELQPLHLDPSRWTCLLNFYLPVVHKNQTVRGGKKGAWVSRKIKHFMLSTFKMFLMCYKTGCFTFSWTVCKKRGTDCKVVIS